MAPDARRTRVNEAASIKYEERASRHSIEFAEKNTIDRITKIIIFFDESDLSVEFMIDFLDALHREGELSRIFYLITKSFLHYHKTELIKSSKNFP